MLRFILLTTLFYFAFKVIRFLLLANKTIKRTGTNNNGFTSGFQGFRSTNSGQKDLNEIEEADFTVIKDDSEQKK